MSELKKFWKCLRLFLFIPLLYVAYTQYSSTVKISIAPNYSCSFDDIFECQRIDKSQRTLVYIIWDQGGFCSEMNQLLLAFAYSVWAKRHFLIDTRKWNYGNFTDYFTFPSKEFDPQLNRTFLGENNTENGPIVHLQTTRTDIWCYRLWIASSPVQSIDKMRSVTHFLWRSISNETRKFIAKHRLKILTNYIAIHVRKGDKLIKEARDIPLTEYITSIQDILYRINETIRTIFVASDDHTVVKQLRQLKPSWHFVYITRRNVRASNRSGHFQKDFNHLTANEKLVQTRLFMSELQMFIDAKYVLCRMSSNVCRFIQILRHQHRSTLLSLDEEWRAT